MTYLNGIVHSHRKTGKVFILETRNIRCVHQGWHGSRRYDIQVLATHASTLVHRYSSLLLWSVPLGQRGHVKTVGRIPGLWCIPKKKSQGVMSGELRGHTISGWSFPDARPIQRPGKTVFRYWRTNDLVCRRVLCVLYTKRTLHSNHRLTRVIFQHTKRLLHRSDHFLTTYNRIA